MPPSTAFLTLCLAIVAILTGPVLATADSAHHARGIEVHAHRRGSLPVLPFVSTPASTSLEARAPRRSRQRSSAARKQAHARHADRTRRPANRKKRPATGKSKPKSVKHANKEPAPAPTGGRSNGGLPPSLKQLSDTLAAGKACANTLDSRSGGFNTNGSGRTYPHYVRAPFFAAVVSLNGLARSAATQAVDLAWWRGTAIWSAQSVSSVSES
jgi:hypothetical protein